MFSEVLIEAKTAALAHFALPSTQQVFADYHRYLQPRTPPIVGVGIGENNIRVYALEGHDVSDIPDYFHSIPTQLVRTTGFFAGLPVPSNIFPHTRPTPCGVSVGHVHVTAGTIGCLVQKDGHRYILSNNHVLADTNRARIGDRIVQPGIIDGGSTPTDDIAELSNFLPIDFSMTNHIDAAIARLFAGNSVNPVIENIGHPATNTITATVNQPVCKNGRTTGLTTGVVVDVDFDGYVGFGTGRAAWFEEQVAISSNGCNPFSLGGDSDSLIVDNNTIEPVALLFAGDDKITLANPIDQVLNAFGVTVVNT